jgi:hypothetical protein
MAEQMITIEADFNNRDERGRLRLSRLAMHRETPFAKIAKRHPRVIFVDGEDVVEGRLVRSQRHGWLGDVDWQTQGVLEHWPRTAVPA